MKIAFYAPLKSPDSPVPSGDRLIGRMLRSALAAGGHSIEVVSTFRSFDRTGDARRQLRLARVAGWHADRIARRLRRQRPDLWFTYHLYHKAPDWIGPRVTHDIGIPYCIAEASLSASQETGRWAGGHSAARAALAHADLLINLNPKDAPGTLPHLKRTGRSITLRPFIDGVIFREAHLNREQHRFEIAYNHGLDATVPWLLAVGMMRPGDKCQSYELLANALAQLLDRPWRLIIIGDGAARPEIEAAMSSLVGRAHFAGLRDMTSVAAYLAASDLFVWPAINEALGMVFIEAAASGLPVVAADRPGIASIVDHGGTGILVAEHDADQFAQAVSRLLDDHELRNRMGNAALTKARAHHDITTQGPLLCRALEALVT